MQPNFINNLVPYTAGDWTPGRQGNVPKFIILHTTDCSARQADSGFHTGARKSSAHRIIAEDGSIYVEVADGDTAWGAANWPVNLAGLNLEHEDNGNYNDGVRTPALYASSAWQLRDWSRRFGIPLKRGTVVNHVPQEPGVYLHKEVSLSGTACPDGLDVDRIMREATAGMGGAPVAPVVEPAAASVPGVAPWGPDKVRITVDTLKVHNDPSANDAGNFGHTGSGDGMLHLDMLADVNGWVRGAQYTIGNQASDLWCHTTSGHYFAALGSDFVQATNLPLLATGVPEAAPAVPAAPSYDFTAQTGEVVVNPAAGANVRTSPLTGDHNINHAVEQGEHVPVIGFVTNGEDVAGNSKWWETADRLFVSDVVVSFVTPAPAPEVPAAPAQPSPALEQVPAASTGATGFPIVPKIDTLYVTDDFVIHDLAGVNPDVQVHRGQVVQEVGTFLAHEATYVLSKKSQDEGNWYGYPLDKLTAIAPGAKTLTDIRPLKPVKELHIEATAAAVGALADAVGVWERIVNFLLHRKKITKEN